MPYSKKIGANLSWAYYAVYVKDFGFEKINNYNTDDDSKIFIVCDMPGSHFSKIAFHGYDPDNVSQFMKPKCFEFYGGDKKRNIPSGKTLYQTIPSTNLIWFVSDGEDEHVYLFSQFSNLVYLMGRMNLEDPITNLCKWRYSRVKS